MILAVAMAFQVVSTCSVVADSIVARAADRNVALRLTAVLENRCITHFDALYRAGRALNRAASADSTASAPRSALAARLLDRATALRPGSAAAWFEFGLALHRRPASMLHARIYVARAVALAERRPDTMPGSLMAELYLQLARDRQDWVDRLRWLKDGAHLPTVTPACSDLGMFCENYTRPASFNEIVRDAPVMAPDLDFRREELLETYDRVFGYDSLNLAAALGRARELALGEEWEPLVAFARRLRARGDGWEFFGMFEALARYRLDRPFAADSLFAAALPALPDSLSRWYQPPAGLAEIPDFWARGRPLWLVPVNELELEYRARVTRALLTLGDPESGVQGPETPQGDALIRYGWPRLVTQFSRDASRIVTAAQQAAALQVLEYCDVGPREDLRNAACNPRPQEGQDHDFSGGRWIVWTYATDRPSMIFEIRSGQRVPRYYFDGPAREYAEQLRARSPMTFESRLAPNTVGLPLQVARFRGETPERTVAAFYGVVPAQEMGLPRAESLGTGLFLFRDGGAQPVARSVAQHVPGAALLLTYSIPLPAGRYSYSVEAWSEARGAAAVARDSLLAPEWRADSLMVSDLLLADTLRTATPRAGQRWSDLGAVGSPNLLFAAGSSLWIVWETYGLHAGEDRAVHYEVGVQLRDETNHALAIRLLERMGVGRRLGRAGSTISWDVERPVTEDAQPVLDWVRLELPEGAPGSYRLILSLVENGTGRRASASRPLRIVKGAESRLPRAPI